MLEGPNKESNGKRGENTFFSCWIERAPLLPPSVILSRSAFGQTKNTDETKLIITPEIRFSEGQHKNK